MKSRSRSFYPPKLNPRWVSFLQTLAPRIAHTVYQLDLMISADPTVHLDTLKQKPCILLCNHPTFDDQVVMFLLSAYLEEPFYYMTAYEQFVGLTGWLYRRIGAYSIQRGLADRESILYTLGLLTQPDCKLVIFPEGGCSFQNDTVMPFRPGAVQIGLQAMTRCLKQGQPVPDLQIVPISLKYRYVGRMKAVIDKTLQRLEQALSVTPSGDYYQRLRHVAKQVLCRFEQEYGLEPIDQSDWNQRIMHLKAKVLQECEQQLGLASAIGEPNRERAYRIRHKLEQQPITVLNDGTDAWEVMKRAMLRVLNFDAIYDGYVGERPTPERFLDTLIRLEREVFGIDKPRPKAHRQAFLQIGLPVSLNEYLEAYSHDRPTTITTLTHQLQNTVQRNLDLLAKATARDISW